MGQALVEVVEALLQDARSYILLLSVLVQHLQQDLDRQHITHKDSQTKTIRALATSKQDNLNLGSATYDTQDSVDMQSHCQWHMRKQISILQD